MKIYKCENEDCKNTSDNTDTWLTIGSCDDSHGLFINNNLPNHKIYEMNNYSDIHFCSKKCFVNAFFTQPSNIENSKPDTSGYELA